MENNTTKITIGEDAVAAGKITAQQEELLGQAAKETLDWHNEEAPVELGVQEMRKRHIEVSRPFIINVVNRDSKPVTILSATDHPTKKQIVMCGFPNVEYEDILFQISKQPVYCSRIRFDASESIGNNIFDGILTFSKSNIFGSTQQYSFGLSEYVHPNQFLQNVVDVVFDKPLPVDGITKMILAENCFSDVRITLFPAAVEDIAAYTFEDFIRAHSENKTPYITIKNNDYYKDREVIVEIDKGRAVVKNFDENKIEFGCCNVPDQFTFLKTYCQDEAQIIEPISVLKTNGEEIKIAPVVKPLEEGGCFLKCMVMNYNVSRDIGEDPANYSIGIGDRFTLLVKANTQITLFLKEKK